MFFKVEDIMTFFTDLHVFLSSVRRFNPKLPSNPSNVYFKSRSVIPVAVDRKEAPVSQVLQELQLPSLPLAVIWPQEKAPVFPSSLLRII